VFVHVIYIVSRLPQSCVNVHSAYINGIVSVGLSRVSNVFSACTANRRSVVCKTRLKFKK